LAKLCCALKHLRTGVFLQSPAFEAAVCAAYANEGMELIRRYVRGEWHSLMLRHK